MTHDGTDFHIPGFATLALHAGAEPANGAPAMPSGTGVFGDLSSRAADPTCAALEDRVAALEGGTAALAVASGRAALQVVFHTLMEPGDELIAAADPHGGMAEGLEHAFARSGRRVRRADPGDPDAVAALATDRTRAVFVESLADPRGALADVGAFAAAARRAGVPLVVDNTLASPCLFRPIEHGADVVVLSAAEFLCGRAGAAGGLIVDGGGFDWMADGRHPALSRPRPECGGAVLGERFGNFAFAVAARAVGLSALGAPLSPSDASAVLAGIETLPLRMRRHCDNALEVAAHLSRHPAVSRVRYPGLPGDPDHASARRQYPRGAGAVVAFELRDGREATAALASRLRLFSRADGVGGTRSLAAFPAPAPDGRPGAVRLSVGIEDAADLIADLDQALAGAGAAA